MEGRGVVSIISHRPVTLKQRFEAKKVVFFLTFLQLVVDRFNFF